MGNMNTDFITCSCAIFALEGRSKSKIGYYCFNEMEAMKIVIPIVVHGCVRITNHSNRLIKQNRIRLLRLNKMN